MSVGSEQANSLFYFHHTTKLLLTCLKVSGQDVVREIAVNLPEMENENDVLATLWARTKIDDLTKQDYNNANVEVQKTITNIGLEFRLLTQFTSFVAVEEITRTVGGKPKRVEFPINLPEGMSEDTPFRRLEIITALQRPSSLTIVATTKGKKLVKSSGTGFGSGQGSGSGSLAGMLSTSSNLTYSASSPPPPVPKSTSGRRCQWKSDSFNKTVISVGGKSDSCKRRGQCASSD